MALRSRLGRRLFSTSTFPWKNPAPAPSQPDTIPSTSLFVSGLNKQTTSEKLKEAFSKFGEVISATVAKDRVSGYSRGFGFVRYATTRDAEQGIKGMDGQFLDGWVIFAEYARPRAPKRDTSESLQS
ncbi:organelle RRM domain-containing protein 2, mitochondrial-like [Aristolochia californica]|uniref:organelle RRM domain-containing protein 2, mitochondrial-like n=1 Tax=Aristolochia californica TaxID=171875 RepID=UPI0035D5465C